MFVALWMLITLPFRLVAGAIRLLGRMTALVIGFGLMVVGVGLGAGTLWLLGVPVFLVGLLLTLRSLG